MSDNIKKTALEGENFTYVRKGILQGSSGPSQLTSPRLLSGLYATPPSPPEHADFYYPELVDILPVNLTVQFSVGPAVEIQINSENVTDIIDTLAAALEDFTISFSNRIITVAAPGTLEWFRFRESDSPDFARILKFPFEDAHAAVAQNHVDAGAFSKNRESFIQRYENSLSDAVNRALSSIASNLETHHVYLSDSIAVPRFVNTEENSGILIPIVEDGEVTGVILKARAYLGTEHNLTPQELERLFTLTVAYGYEALNLLDQEQPARVTEVTTGDGGSPRKFGNDFVDYENPVAQADTRGDGGSVLPCSVLTLSSDAIVITEVIDGCMIRLDWEEALTDSVIPVNSVVSITMASIG